MNKYRFAIIGGAYDSFMGPVHRIAASLDGRAELVAGAFSRNHEKNIKTAEQWYVDHDRAYSSYEQLLLSEQGALDFVVIATPNHLHIPIIARAVELGYAVVSDKPLGIDFESAYTLYQERSMGKKNFMLTHNYSGYSMVKEARRQILDGAIGPLHRIVVQYEQGWLQAALQKAVDPSSMWRLDSKQVGGVLSLGDIGSHALHLLHYVTGLQVCEVMAEARSGVPGNPLDTDVNILLRFNTDAIGSFSISQCSTGLRNPFALAVYGATGGLSWCQEESEQLKLTNIHGSERYLYRGSKDAPESLRWARVAMGHPEGYLGAFANLYKEYYRALDATVDPFADYDIPSYEDGLDGLAFIEAVQRSLASGSWSTVRYPHRSADAAS